MRILNLTVPRPDWGVDPGIFLGMTEMSVEIVPYRPEHAGRFESLNRLWLEQYGLMEPSDAAQIADPKSHFLDRGGEIIVALHQGEVVGTCVAVPHGPGEFEIAKLAVDPAVRGQGIARRLVERSLEFIRSQGVTRVALVSNSQLLPALRLYESLGFKYLPVPEVREYQTADIYMALEL